MSEIPTGVGIGAIIAGVAMLLKVCADIILKWKKADGHSNGTANGKSGDLSPAYWQLEFRKAVQEELIAHEGRMRDIVREECGDRHQK